MQRRASDDNKDLLPHKFKLEVKRSLNRSKTIKGKRFTQKSSFAKDEGSEWNSSEESSKPNANKHE